jgi:nicotinate phosphoribosyltransferase
LNAWVDDRNAVLLTDLYELTMAAGYVDAGIAEGEAAFELFVRRLPDDRRFLVACGIEQAVGYLTSLAFDDDALGYLDGLGLFDGAFLDRLRSLRFTGDVWAVAEGEVVFANEPLLRVTAPLIEAQLVETFLLATVGFQTMVASKAARVAIAAAGRPFADFSARRDHGPDAALKAARAAYVGGAASTSNVLAGQAFGIPLSGTMAHSYVMAFADEREAFRRFATAFPGRAVLLIDTYDTRRGAERVVEVAREGHHVAGVRLDSGDLGALARDVRAILDAGGLHDVQVLASGDLDEHRVAALVAAGAPIDGFGVGTRLGTSDDAPSLGVVYKLVADPSGPRMKRSEGKVTVPGCKQVHRLDDHDVVARHDEPAPGGRPLLEQVVGGGTRVRDVEPLEAARDRATAAVAALPATVRDLAPGPSPWPVRTSEALVALQREVEAGLAAP